MASIGACSTAPDPVRTPTVVDADPLATDTWRPDVEHQQCGPIAPRLSSVAELADSVALVRALASAQSSDAGHVLWTIAFDGNGMLADVRVLESTLDPAATFRLEGKVREALRSQDGETYVRLRLDLDAASVARLRIGGIQYCQATLLNVDAVRLAMAAIDRDGQVGVELYVDQEGHVEECTITASSGDPITDRMVLGLVGGLEYSPARLERHAVPSRVVYTVNLD